MANYRPLNCHEFWRIKDNNTSIFMDRAAQDRVWGEIFISFIFRTKPVYNCAFLSAIPPTERNTDTKGDFQVTGYRSMGVMDGHDFYR